MYSTSLIALALLADTTLAYPWVAKMPGIDTRLLRSEMKNTKRYAGDAASCPNNPTHTGAAPYTSPYLYNHAQNGMPGLGQGGFQVPADGDTAHQFVAPDYSKDIRGPCPGLNVLANHNFLSHDGITTFNELVDAQQNVYNVGYDLAVLLAVLGLTTTDGDIATERLSIGCDATSRTSVNPTLTGSEPGLDGHDKFEADTSLTRNDYFTHNGDNFEFNGTLFGMMTETTGGTFDLEGLALYREQRYHQSIAENPNFYFGPLSLLLFGAASFLYELMPSGPDYTPDLATISSFFGAEKQTDGTWTFTGEEKIPYGWTNRLTPYTNNDVTTQILEMYLLHPVLFGGNTGNNQFDVITDSSGLIKDGKLTTTDPTSVLCFIYQLATASYPSSLNSILTPTVAAVEFAVSKLGPQYAQLGCPLPLAN